MNKYFLWYVKTCKYILKTIEFEGFADCVCERKRYQANINETNIHSEIDTELMRKRCLKNWYHNDGTRCEHGFQKGSTIWKHCQKYINKNDKIWHQNGTHFVATVAPKRDTLRGHGGEWGGLLTQTVPKLYGEHSSPGFVALKYWWSALLARADALGRPRWGTNLRLKLSNNERNKYHAEDNKTLGCAGKNPSNNHTKWALGAFRGSS